MPISAVVPGVVKVSSKFEGEKVTKLQVYWFKVHGKKDDGKPNFVMSTATLVAFGKVDAEKGDKLEVTEANITNEESEDWVTGKKGNKDSVRPARWLTYLVDASNVKVLEGERKHSAKVEYPATDDTDDDLPF